KVGYLVKIPGTVFATTKQVAQFYAVPEEIIRTIIARDKNELKTNGYNVLLRKDLGEFQDEFLIGLIPVRFSGNFSLPYCFPPYCLCYKIS
ncbi:MAG: hypothetical protein AABZ60_15410, partial [Planctomycetota bacterium]